MEIRFMAMKTVHLDGVTEIENQSFPTPWSRTAFYHEIAGNDFAYYIVAMYGTKVAGYAGMWIILDEGHVTTIAVHHHYRGKGLGSRLVNQLINNAIIRSCKKMTLEVRPTNQPALELYQKTGFVSHGIRPGYYADTGEDAIIMWKDLYPVIMD